MNPSRPPSNRKIGRLLFLLAGVALPSTAWGQEAVDKLNRPAPSPRPGEWIVEWSASAEPAFQIARDQIGQMDPRDLQDEGEYALAASFKGSFPRLVEVSFAPSVTINPNWFDDEEDEASGWSLTARARRKTELPRGDGSAPRRPPMLLPFATYTYGQSFDGLFDERDTDDRTFTIGATWANVLCAAVGCADDPARKNELTVSYAELDSSDDDNDARGPTVQIEWGRPAFGDTDVWLKASADVRSYDSLMADSGGGAAESARYTVAVGLDVSGWARRRLRAPKEVEVGIALRWVTVEANRADLEREDFALVPTVSWKR